MKMDEIETLPNFLEDIVEVDRSPEADLVLVDAPDDFMSTESFTESHVITHNHAANCHSLCNTHEHAREGADNSTIDAYFQYIMNWNTSSNIEPGASTSITDPIVEVENVSESFDDYGYKHESDRIDDNANVSGYGIDDHVTNDNTLETGSKVLSNDLTFDSEYSVQVKGENLIDDFTPVLSSEDSGLSAPFAVIASTDNSTLTPILEANVKSEFPTYSNFLDLGDGAHTEISANAPLPLKAMREYPVQASGHAHWSDPSEGICLDRSASQSEIVTEEWESGVIEDDNGFEGSLMEEPCVEIDVACSMEGIFPCTLCDLACSTEAMLEAHMQQLHPDVCLRKEHGWIGVFKRFIDGEKLPTVADSLDSCPDVLESGNGPKEMDRDTACISTQDKERDKSNQMSYPNGEKSCKCTVCGKVYAGSGLLKRHMLAHTGERPHKCSSCDKAFGRRGDLNRHVRVKHNASKEPRRVVRNEAFLDAIDLKRHVMSSHAGEKSHPCIFCGKGFSRRSNLRKHVMKTHRGEIWPQCSICDKKFKLEHDLRVHMIKTHPEEEQHKCSLCDETFYQSQELKHMMRSHVEEKPSSVSDKAQLSSSRKKLYKCSVCGGTFVYKSKIQRHMHVHMRKKMNRHLVPEKTIDQSRGADMVGTGADKKSSRCSLCDESFSHPQQLQLHVLRIHSRKEPYKCGVCEKTFARDCDLKEHINKIHKSKKHKCHLCEEVFGVQRDLKRHIKIHTQGTRDARCTVCGKIFSRYRALQIHMSRLHAKNKPFKCHLCEKVFALQYDLERHIKIHTGDIQCTVCGKSFSSTYDLLRHMRIYARKTLSEHRDKTVDHRKEVIVTTRGDEKSLRCTVCGESFSYPVESSPTHVLRIHTRNEPYKCGVCAKGFAQNSDIERPTETHIEEINKRNVGGKSFSFKSDLKHLKKHSIGTGVGDNDKQYQCSLCDQAFSLIHDLEEHMIRSHSGIERPTETHIEEINKRSVGGKSFSFKSDLKHLKKHSIGTGVGDNYKQHQCSLCDQAFSLIHDLEEHMIRSHSGIERPTETHIEEINKRNVGGKSFSFKSDLKHLKKHSIGTGVGDNDKQHQCSLCDQAFGLIHDLEEHMIRSHSGIERPTETHIEEINKRNVGGKSFSLKSDLKHLKKNSIGTGVGDNDKQYQCSLCDQAFGLIHDLEEHMIRSHSGIERPTETHIEEINKRNVGGKSFSLKSDLKHLKKHSIGTGVGDNDKQYQCSLCDQAFGLIHDLEEHMIRSHSGEKLHKCSTCDKKFPTSQSLNLHALKMHYEDRQFQGDVKSQTGENSLRHAEYAKAFGITCDLKICLVRIDNEEKPHRCAVCKKAFSKRLNLRMHKIIHVEGKSYKCSLCDRTFLLRKYLKQHVLGVHKQKTHQCSVCGKSFGLYSVLIDHMRTHSEKQPCKCSACSKTFWTKRGLQRHMKVHNREKSHKCSICDKAFGRKVYLAKHMIRHKINPNQCSVCGKLFGLHSALKAHMKIHTGEQEYKCSLCHKAFVKRSNLQIHMRTHSDSEEQPCKCSACPKTFLTKRGLQRHMKVHNREKSHKCSICDKAFGQKVYLAKHMIRHKINPNQCSVCGKLFGLHSALKAHMKIHTGEQKYKCSLCHKAFVKRSNLQIHMRTHSGEKPYKCAMCSQVFSTKKNLQRHCTRKHAEGKSHKCSICDKVYSYNCYLMRHMAIHNSKPHQCSHCDQSFDLYSVLMAHMKIHTGKKQRKCHVCNKVFCRKSGLVNHMATRHGRETFNCSICSCMFMQRRSLKKHMTSIHNGEKPCSFKCSLCTKSFSKKYYLDRHVMRNHNEVKPYRCSLCDKAFVKPWILNNHIKYHSDGNSSIDAGSGKSIKPKKQTVVTLTHNSGKSHTFPVCSKTFDSRTNLQKHKIIHSGEKTQKCTIPLVRDGV